MVEFQFYVLFPFIVAYFGNYGFRYIAGLIGVTVLLRIVIYLGDGTVQEAAYGPFWAASISSPSA